MLESRNFLAIGVLAAAAMLGASSGFAQNSSGADYHPLNMNSPTNPDVQAGAMQAARPTGTEAIGQSTGAPQMNSKISEEEVRKGAIAASHASGTEAIGQSTGMPMVRSGQSASYQNGKNNRNGQGG